MTLRLVATDESQTARAPWLPPPRPAGEGNAAPPVSHELLRRAVDRLALAVLVVDADGSVVMRNAPAERILAAQDGLRLRGETLSAERAADARALKGAIGDAISGRVRAARSPFAVVTVSRASGGAPLILLVAPLSEATPASPASPSLPVALVLVSDLEWPVPNYAQQLRVGFGLTDSETSVAVALMDGQRPKEIASRRGVSPSTVSTQMKAIFAKTGAQRQSDLVKLISRLPSLGQSL